MPEPERPTQVSPLGGALVALFVASGAAALIYEVVWFQLLQLVIGSSAVSMAVLLTTFMGGTCLGSLLAPRAVSATRHPLRVYAAVEASIAVLAVIVLLGAPRITIAHASIGTGVASLTLRAFVAAVCLLPPTILMGSTLPLVSRWASASSHNVTWIGLLYSGNIVGAVGGCLIAALYLLRLYDVTVATAAAVLINLLVAAAAYLLARRSEMSPTLRAVPEAERRRDIRGATAIHVVIALSGLAALGAEVVWTRVLSLVIGATVYAFAMILAVFLLGLGMGSGIGALLARRVSDPRRALGTCQWMLVGACAWAAWMLASVLPYWPVNPALTQSPWLAFQIDLTRCAWAVVPATVLWGASFPLALAAVVSRPDDPARLVGELYAANTVGAILGAALASLVAIPTWGTQGTERALVIVSALAGTIALYPAIRARLVRGGRHATSILAIGSLIAACVAVWLVVKLPAVPGLLVAYGRYLVTVTDPVAVLYTGDGLHSSIAVTRLPDGVRNFHVSGKIEASSQRDDMRLQRMLGHLPALVHPTPASVLVVGFGAGVTAGSFVAYPEVRRIVVAEIEPLIPRAVGAYFTRENHDVLHDPRLELVYDDARQYIASTDERFDVITSDPIHPWVKGSAALYTREYFEMLAKHLKPGGLVTQWLPLYESDLEVVRSQMATFFDVFPHATVWANLQNERGYDLVLLGESGDAPIDVTAADGRFRDSAHSRAAASLREVGLDPVELFSTYSGRATDLATWLAGASINRDRNLRLQYLAGLQANRYDSDAIYTEIVEHKVYPEGLFVGRAEQLEALRVRLTR